MKFKPTKIATALFLLAVLPSMATGQARLNKNGKQEDGSQVQPRGNTGPINTKSGGAPASSPQKE